MAAQLACCACSCAQSICCSLASCFGCHFNKRLAKLLYLLIFALAGTLAVVLRFWGQQALQSWVSVISTGCDAGQCWGVQAVYRVSWSLAIFFAFMTVLVAVFPVTHYGGWLAKLMLWVLLLGLSLLVSNGSMQTFAEAARVFSVIFLLAQCLIVVDFAYKAHEWLLAKADEYEAEAASRGWEPGLCSNYWKVLYIVLSVLFFAAGVVGCALMFNYFSGGAACGLDTFFITETLVIGIVLTGVSLLNAVGKGLLPPSVVFATNAYLCYGSITNNPDLTCNRWAPTGDQNQVAIIVGLVIAVVSIAWMAYSSASSMYSAVIMSEAIPSTTVPTPAIANPAVGAGAPTAYQAAADEEAGAAKAVEGSPAATAATPPSSPRAPAKDDDSSAGPVDRTEAVVFHLVMFLAGCYVAMMASNWASPEAAVGAPVPIGNPELSTGSMWARMGSQFAIQVLFTWTLVAHLCCPNRDFSTRR